MTLSINSVTTIEECRQIETLQIQIWGMELLDIVPDHLLLTVAKNQGIVLLARLDDRPVGFVFGFLGETRQGIRKHCSHMAGVLPEIQGQSIGYQLKLAQREAVLAQGIELMTWTFDPLISLNANLNIGKLGAVSHTYHRQLYGRMRSEINQDLSSDRLEVSWWLNSAQVTAKLSHLQSPISFNRDLILNQATLNQKGLLSPPETLQSPIESAHFIQIPPDIEAIKVADMSLAIAWRKQTRYLFESVFAAGYAVTDFVRLAAQNESYYVIQRRS